MMHTGVLFALVWMAVACSKDQPRNNDEDYGDIYQRNGNSFILSQETHPTGWGHQQCYMCHNPDNIHRIDRVDSIVVDLEQIRSKTQAGGTASCSACHGANGN